MSEFYKGDTVRCIKNNSRNELTVGRLYKVIDIPDYYDLARFVIVINDKGVIEEYMISRFVKVSGIEFCTFNLEEEGL